VNKAQYTALLESYQKARLGERADNAGSVRFEVALPPTSPLIPVWPQRTLWLAEIWLASLVVGAGAAYGLHMLRPIVSSARAISEMTNFPVLGVVSTAFPRRERKDFWRHLLGFSAATSCLLFLFVLVLILNWSGARLSVAAIQSLVKT
jgi:hypothetical protein